MKESTHINGSNYEAYFLDYYEKTLDTTGVAELMIFLEANPELQAEFEGFELLCLTPDAEVVFDDKASLKKNALLAVSPIHEGNYEEYLIASVEKLLTDEEEAKLAAFIQLNPSVAHELALFRMTVLQADTHIVFEAKSSLKHEALAPVLSLRSNKGLYAFLAVAASLTILFVLYFTLSPVKTGPQLASRAKPAVIQKALQDKSLPAAKEIQAPAQISRETIAHSVKAHKEGNQQLPANATGTEIQSLPLLADASMNSIPLRQSHAVLNSFARARKIKSKERTEYSGIYRDYMLRNQMEYSQYLDEQESRSLLARTFSKVRQGISGPDEFNPNAAEEQNLLWSVAGLGLKGINAVTNADLRLIRKINSEGRTQSYAVKSDRAEYSKVIDK